MVGPVSGHSSLNPVNRFDRDDHHHEESNDDEIISMTCNVLWRSVKPFVLAAVLGEVFFSSFHSVSLYCNHSWQPTAHCDTL